MVRNFSGVVGIFFFGRYLIFSFKCVEFFFFSCGG